MEQQIQDLIASIRKEGIESATNESKKILEEARKEADRIISEAAKEKEKMLKEAQKAIDLERQSAESSVRQAARDVSLTLKKDIESKLMKILGEKVSSSMDASVISRLIVAVVNNEFGEAVAEVPTSEIEEVKKLLSSEFASTLKNGVTLKSSSASGSGVRIYEKDGSAYVDLSDEECTKLLHPYLSSSLKDII